MSRRNGRSPGREASAGRSTRRRRTLIVLALLCAPGCGGSSGPERGAWETPDEGLDARVAELVTAQIQRLERAPSDASAAGELGLIYAANSMWRNAGDAFRRASELQPTEPLWSYYLALSVRESQDFARALEILRGAVQRTPQHAYMQHRLGMWLLEDGRVPEAERALFRVQTLAPGSAAGYSGMASVKLAQGRPADALVLAERALELDPTDLVAVFTKGSALLRLGRADEANAFLVRGSGAAPRFMADPAGERVDAYRVTRLSLLARADGQLAAGQSEEGAKLLERALEADPTDASVLNDLARVYTSMGRLEEAYRLQRRALANARGGKFSAYLHTNLANGCLVTGRLDEAIENAEAAVRKNPSLARAHHTLGVALGRVGRTDDALAALERSVELDASAGKAHADLAAAYVGAGRLSEARAEYLAARSQLAEPLAAAFALIEVCLDLGDLEGAREALDQAAGIAPGHRRLASFERRLSREREP